MYEYRHRGCLPIGPWEAFRMSRMSEKPLKQIRVGGDPSGRRFGCLMSRRYPKGLQRGSVLEVATRTPPNGIEFEYPNITV